MSDIQAIQEAIDRLSRRVIAAENASTSNLAQGKANRALSEIRRARNLLGKANQTALWLEFFKAKA